MDQQQQQQYYAQQGYYPQTYDYSQQGYQQQGYQSTGGTYYQQGYYPAVQVVQQPQQGYTTTTTTTFVTNVELQKFYTEHGPNKEKKDWALQSPRMLQVNLNGLVWIKRGSMRGYTGNIRFTRESVINGGIGKMIKRSIAHENIFLTRAEGSGTLFCGDQGKCVQILHLKNESMCVNGHKILAFDNNLQWDITLMKTFAGVIEGGYFNVTFSGTGSVAICTYFEPLTLEVKSGNAVYTDPHATVAWSGHLRPSVKIDVSIKTFLGRGSGESLQMEFAGDSGFVVVQPVEELHISRDG